MSAPIKPKSGGVNLFLTDDQFTLLGNALGHYNRMINILSPGVGYDANDLLTVIQSQSKESSND